MKLLRLLPALLVATAARLSAVMIDEIQVYDDSINDPHEFGLELHLNSTLQGRTAPDYPGEITPQNGFRATAEFSYGVNRDFEAGLYVPSVYAPNHHYYAPGYKLRMKWIPIHPKDHDGWFAGSNGELSNLETRANATRWSFESRNIFGWRDDDWEVASNFVFEFALSGAEKSVRPGDEIDLKISRTIAKGIAFGPEYYAAFGPLGRPDSFAEQDHTLYAAFDVDMKPWVFNVGIGRGISHAADRWTVKFIWEVPW